MPPGTPKLQEDHHGAGEPLQAAAPPHGPSATRPRLTDKEGQCGPWAMSWKGRKTSLLRASRVQQHVFEAAVQLG